MKFFRKIIAGRLTKPDIVSLTIIVLLGLTVASGYLRTGFPATDDGNWMVLRATGFHESIRDGHFPVRWIQRLNENYGYPVMNFLYPLPFYLAEIFSLVGFTSLSSIKLLFIVSTVISGITMWSFLRATFTPLAAVIGSLVYLVLPYRLVDLYYRGSLGEVVVFIFIPLVLLGIQTYFRKKKSFWLLFSAIFWAATVVSHNSLGLLFSLVYVGYVWIEVDTSTLEKVKTIVLTGGIAAILSAWFWLPALAELSFTRANETQIANVAAQYQSLKTILAQLGIYSILILVASVGLIKKKNRSHIFFFCLGVVGVIFQFQVTTPLWSMLHLPKLVQFPVRLLAFNVLGVTWLSSYLWDRLEKFSVIVKVVIGVLGLGLLVVPVYSSLVQLQINDLQQSAFDTNFDTTTVKREFTPKTVTSDPQTYATAPFTLRGASPNSFEVVETSAKTQEKYLQVMLKGEVEVTVNTHYFPGWKILVDDEAVTPKIDEAGRPVITLVTPDRRNRTSTVQMLWTETPVRKLANSISFIGWASLVLLGVYVFSNKDYVRTLGLMSLLIVVFNLVSASFIHLDEITQVFNAKTQEEKYLNSQWVNPASTEPIGDHGLYTWAGWSYVHGIDPTLINSEMPPLGKYLIGLGIVMTQRPGLVGLFFSATFVSSVYALSVLIIKNRWLAIVPVALLTSEYIFKSSVAYTMLDNIQLTFMTLAFYSLIRAEKNAQWFVFGALMMGGVLSTKFYATGILLTLSVVGFYLITKRWISLKRFLVVSPLIVLVHVLSYTRYFLLGHSLREYLGVQKWIYQFYKSGSPEVPLASYWKLVFFNRWRVWWGPRFGEYYTLVTKEWRLTWPINASAVFVLGGVFIQQLYSLWLRGKNCTIPVYYVLLCWLLCYSVFLTLIGGWPHYMLQFLPYSSILLVKIIYDKRHSLDKKIRNSQLELRNKFKFRNTKKYL